jgi:hypothetical protein
MSQITNHKFVFVNHKHKNRYDTAPIIARNPYTPTQLITNTVHLHLQSGIFQMKELEDWEATPNKTWPELKTYIHGVYTQHLVAVRLLAQQGYLPAHNMYNIMGTSGNDTDEESTVVTIIQMAAAAMMGSTLANTYATLAQAPTDLQIALAIIPLLPANKHCMNTLPFYRSKWQQCHSTCSLLPHDAPSQRLTQCHSMCHPYTNS